MREFHIITFSNGQDKDVDPRAVSNDVFHDSENITLTDSGNHLTATNLRGTTQVDTILAKTDIDNSEYENFNLMGAFKTEWTNIDDGNMYEHITLFYAYRIERTADFIRFKVSSYDIDNDQIREIAQEDIKPGDPRFSFSNQNKYLTSSISAEVVKEGDVDSIYFVDDINPLRKIKCEYSTSGFARVYRNLDVIFDDVNDEFDLVEDIGLTELLRFNQLILKMEEEIHII